MPLPVSFPKCRGIAKHRYFLSFLPMAAWLPQIAKIRGKQFPNDHLDLFFNATVDAAIVMTTLLCMVVGGSVGVCPYQRHPRSSRDVREMFSLPEKVIPIAGMCVGSRREAGSRSYCSLNTTVHEERFAENFSEVDAYDQRRAATRPYRNQREPERFGRSEFYGWSKDKARQMPASLRADFGAFVRAKGFNPH